MGFARHSPSRCKDAQSIRFVFAKPFAMQWLGGCAAIGVGLAWLRCHGNTEVDRIGDKRLGNRRAVSYASA